MGEDAISVRPAREADLGAVRELLHELAEHQRDWRVFTPRRGYEDEVFATYRNAVGADHPLLLVAERGGQVMGMAFAHEHAPSRLSDERALEVSGVVVRPSERRRGVGRALIAAVLVHAADRGLARITLQTFAPNEDAARFWRSLGLQARKIEFTGTVGDLMRPGRA